MRLSVCLSVPVPTGMPGINRCATPSMHYRRRRGVFVNLCFDPWRRISCQMCVHGKWPLVCRERVRDLCGFSMRTSSGLRARAQDGISVTSMRTENVAQASVCVGTRRLKHAMSPLFTASSRTSRRCEFQPIPFGRASCASLNNRHRCTISRSAFKSLDMLARLRLTK